MCEGNIRVPPMTTPPIIRVVGDTPAILFINHLNSIKMSTEIKGRQAMKIQAIAGELDYKAETKMAGKKYRRFAYDGHVFIANTEDAFCSTFDAGKIYSVSLDSNDDGQLSLVGHTSVAQELNMAKTEALLSVFTVENFVAGKVDYAELIN